MGLRPLEGLIDREDPAWPLVQARIARARRPIEVLPASDPGRSEALLATQVTTRSPMGAIIYETGGLLVDHGWLRILGSGHPRLPRSLPEWNRGRTMLIEGEPPPFLLVADDVLGGFFAIDGGALTDHPGIVHYFAPDSLRWEDMSLKYTQFLGWCLEGDLERYYSDWRWPGWETGVADLPGDRGFSVYPPLWAKGPPIAERDRRSVPLAELYSLNVE